MRIKPGDLIEARDASGVWHRCLADSEIEGVWDGRHKIHDFPVVWILLGGDRIPWPASSVRTIEELA